MRRSTYGFCQGDLGDIGRSRIPIVPDAIRECPPIGAIIVAHQIGRRRAPRECLRDLLRQPLGGRVPGNLRAEPGVSAA